LACQIHRLQERQPGFQMPRLLRFLCRRLKCKVSVVAAVRPFNDAVQRSNAGLADLAALGLRASSSVLYPSCRWQDLPQSGESRFHVFRGRSIPTHHPPSPQGNVNVGVLGVEVPDGHPLQSGAKVPFHPLHQFPRQLLQVNAFAKLRRHNKFPQSCVTLLLPSVKACDGSVPALSLLSQRFSPAAPSRAM